MKEAYELTAKIMDNAGFPVLILLVFLLFLLETKFQLRKRQQNRWRRIVTNIAVGLPAFILLRLVFIPIMVWIAFQNQRWNVGFNYLIGIPRWPAFIIGFMLLDYFIYLWHRLTHMIPVLWRFHLVHHTDLDLDVSSSIRFHFGELFLSVIFRGMSVLVVGASPLLVLVYEICFEVATNFQHSNWKLPLRLEKILNFLIVTPRMHGAHHSIVKPERNSNWGTIFSIWDRIHNTYSGFQGHNTIIGEAEYQDKKKLSIKELIFMPFRKMER